MEHRHGDAHDVALVHRYLCGEPGGHQRLLQHLRGHDGAGYGKGGIGLRQPLLHPLAQLTGAAYLLHELLHEAVPLVLEELVAPEGRFLLGLQPGQLHAGGIDGLSRHSDQSSLGRYLSTMSPLMRLSSSRGNRRSNSQPRSSVSVMERSVSKP